jgi:O-antigen biosynthesis protein
MQGASTIDLQLLGDGASATSAPPGAAVRGAVRVDGKQFAVDGRRFQFRGVTYGTFKPRAADGARFPVTEQVDSDFRAMGEAGFSVVRTYHPPTDDVLELAGDCGLRVMADVFYPDWRYLLGCSHRQDRRVRAQAVAEVRATARRLRGDTSVLALCLGNEIPADVVRWIGTRRVAALIEELAAAVREEDPERLVTYANYPTAEYLPLECVDFLTFNVYLERRADFRRYLTRLHHLAGDRPLVLGELGGDAGTDAAAERGQADTLDWQLATALERGVAGTCIFSWTDEWWVGDHAVEGWHFGLTSADRAPRAAFAVAERWNRSTVADLHSEWPSVSVVICAYNAAQTLDECLRHTCALDYPDVEVIVVDDGSTDDTAAIALAHPRARLITVAHGGLSAARNEGFQAARGELVAYLDSDAYPTPEWLYYLVLGLDGPKVGGVGGPNLPPRGDPRAAQQVARAPGGPVHVLLADDRAEHVPGCNMMFWRDLLRDVGGFDPVYEAAGDDVDFCWKVIDRGWELGFHPAALVWHHSRGGVRPYLRQQHGYGRAEALVEARHPHRFTATGTARWRGRIYDSFAPSLLHQRVYRGSFGAAAYQSVYQDSGHGAALTRQIGIPVAALVIPTGALGLVWPVTGIPALSMVLLLAALLVAETALARPPRGVEHPLRFRVGVAILSLLQPLARTWGRSRHRTAAHAGVTNRLECASALARPQRNVVLLPEDRPREQLTGAIVSALLCRGLRVRLASPWEDHDARVLGSTLVEGRLVTSSHPVGCVQVRTRPRLRPISAVIYAAVLITALLTDPVAGGLVLGAIGLEAGRGLIRSGPVARRALGSPAAPGRRRRSERLLGALSRESSR